MQLTYYGHSAFLWTSPAGVRILIDPFGESPRHHWFRRPFPAAEADVCLVTHEHFDHSGTGRVGGRPTLLRGPGEFRLRDVSVHGVVDEHTPIPGRDAVPNTMFVVECGGLRLCHGGDNRHDPPAAVRDRLGAIDLLTVPADDSCHLLSYEQIERLVDRLDPRIVVPVHYFVEGLTTEESTLRPPTGWLETQ
ncbi:MAG: MBL fold metallo-hydrolase, partial [Planctomycetota bacterium]